MVHQYLNICYSSLRINVKQFCANLYYILSSIYRCVHFYLVFNFNQSLSLCPRHSVSDIALDSFLRLNVLAITFYFVAIVNSYFGEMSLWFVDEFYWLNYVRVHAILHVLIYDRFKDDSIGRFHEYPVGVLLPPRQYQVIANVFIILCHKNGPLAADNNRDFGDSDATVDLEVYFDFLRAFLVLGTDDPYIRL